MQQRTNEPLCSQRVVLARRAGWLRFVAALCASFVVAGYFAAVAHMAFVAHVLCAEHGQLVHADRASVITEEPSGAPSANGGNATSPDEHDHCLLGIAQPGEAHIASARCDVLDGDRPGVTAPMPVRAPPNARVPLKAPIALLLLSPKSSPPA